MSEGWEIRSGAGQTLRNETPDLTCKPGASCDEWKMGGIDLEELDTPALVVDLDVLERNIEKMREFLSGGTAGIRPHAKTHKTPAIARLQMEAGAVGITCAKLGEAEALVDHGIKDILIANEVVGREKVRRLSELARRASVTVAVDCRANIEELDRSAVKAGVTIGAIVEIDVGNHRAGARSVEEAVALAEVLSWCAGLRYRGVMGYEGHAVFIRGLEDRRKEAEKAYRILLDLVSRLASRGLPPEIVSTAGTGTFMFAGRTPGITDIQAGSYIFMDQRYRCVEGLPFEQSLFVLSTVMSCPEPGVYICDAGTKSMSSEFGLVATLPGYGLQVRGMSEEHVTLVSSGEGGGADLALGSKVLLVPSHCCTTVNLHDFIYGFRKGKVEVCWSIAGRGRSR
ncbi:MAG TPA: DSD1 family PLP-dependent enzyme [Firmicutes bacterium]|nr:DSD1 family PLP-dependent enzyme [Candidatus Fermentithermobacillaceae bacterium]